MSTTETAVQITPDTDLREVLKAGDRARIEFEVKQVNKTNITSHRDRVFTRTETLRDYPITIIRPAEPTIAEQIEALPVGTRFILHHNDGGQSLFFRVRGGCAIAPFDSPVMNLGRTTATRIEVLP